MSQNENHVDILAEARDAQWSSLTFLGEDAIKAVAPAKVNLFLAIGQKREDGYHDVTNVMHALALHDVLFVNRVADEAGEDVEAVKAPAEVADDSETEAIVGPQDNIFIKLDVSDKTSGTWASSNSTLGIPAGKNLVVQAIDAFACELGRNQKEQFLIRLEKHIPAQAGLGGGSSDAAAALLAAAHFWEIEKDDPVIRKVAASLGADVAFFLDGGCELLVGIGEKVEARLATMKGSLVLVKPPCGVSTRQAYAAFDEAPIFPSEEMLAQVFAVKDAAEVPLYNNMQDAAFKIAPDVHKVYEWLKACTCSDGRAPEVLLCGSGACVFALTESHAEALGIASNATKQGWWARATSFSALRAAVI